MQTTRYGAAPNRSLNYSIWAIFFGFVGGGADAVVFDAPSCKSTSSSPASTNETLSTVTLHILSASGDTLETFTFVNARLASDTQSHTGAAGDLPLEQVSFSFQKVTETVGSFVTTEDRSGPPV